MRETITIKDVLVEQKPYRLLEYIENLKDLMDILFSVDVVEEKNITVTVKGEGTVVIYKNGVEAAQLVLDGSQVQWEDTCIAGEKAIYSIENAACLTELDLRENSITGFYANRDLPLKKLILLENEIQTLDCSHFTELQFLHIFNNPMCLSCSDMENMIKSLPNRSTAATGSIIFYPWVGLETLIEEKEEDGVMKYVKYPYDDELSGGFSNPNNPHYGWLYDSNGKYNFEENRFYAIVDRKTGEDQIIGYGVYQNRKFITAGSPDCPKEYTLHQIYQNMRRKNLEKIALPKNWVFGSGIMYHDDWKKCPWDYRQNHIADIWETAEKGFGLTLGTWENMSLMFPGSKYLNIIRFEDCWNPTGYCDYEYVGSDNTKRKRTLSFLKGEITHGDRILSLICGNGADKNQCPGEVTITDNGVSYSYRGAADDQRMGYVPLCKLQLLEKYTNNVDMYNQIEKFASMTDPERNCDTDPKWNCDTITSATGFVTGKNDKDDEQQVYEKAGTARSDFTKYSASHIFTATTGNYGDGNAYTADTPENYFYDAAYGSNAFVEGEEKTGVIFNYALDREKRVAPNVQNSPAAERAKLTPVDFMSQYGQYIMTHKNLLEDEGEGQKVLVGRLGYLHGTSFSAPILNAMLMLLRIIYTKMILAQKEADTSEKEDQEVDERLISFGKYSPFMNYVREHWCDRLPHLMDAAGGYGMVDVLAEPVENRFLSSQPTAECSGVFQVGCPITFSYAADATKDGFTVGYDREMFALTGDNTLYPIRPTTEKQSITLYSNSSRAVVTDNYYEKNYYENTFSVPSVAENAKQSILTGEEVEPESQNFTIFLMIDFLDAAENNKSWYVKIVKKGSPTLCLEIPNGWGNAAANTSIFEGKRLVWRVLDGTTDLGFEIVCLPLENYLYHYCKGVLAITKSEAGLITYFNGNRCSFMPLEELLSVQYQYRNIAFNVDENDIYKYAGSMSETEIICNTAAILKNYESKSEETENGSNQ